jgi:uncharacterized membrane protein
MQQYDVTLSSTTNHFGTLSISMFLFINKLLSLGRCRSIFYEVSREAVRIYPCHMRQEGRQFVMPGVDDEGYCIDSKVYCIEGKACYISREV